MRSTLTTSTLESKFPVMAVEHGCIVSKDADITAAFEVELPEVYTVTAEEYEAIHATWCKAIKALPDYSVLHKQDWYVKERYRPDTGREGMGFLARSYEMHFNERPFLHHKCYLFLTKTTKERMRQQSNWNTLCRKFLVPKEIQDRETMERFMESVGQFESIVNDSGLVRLERLSTEEITGTEDGPGIIERYLTLSANGSVMLQDMQLNPDEMRIGDKRLCLHTLSDLDDLPGRVRTDGRYERLSTDRSDCRLSYASPVGIMLPCDHIYNQWIFIDDSSENLARFEKTAKNMQSLSRYSRSNQINKEWLDEYLNVAHTNGLQSVRCHCNVIAWAENGDELRRVKNDVGSALALMECTPRHNTTDLPVLYWAGIPGNEADFPSEESFYTFTEQALCFFTAETCYRNSLSPFGLRMVDRLTGKPVFLDISDLPMKKGVVTNRNKFILGPSGSGKSFFTNHMVRQYWEQGTHILLVDTGNSYKGLCDLIRQKTNGDDGVYFTYQENDPISFNPFFTEDYRYDIEKRDSIKTLILTLWKREDEPPRRSEEVALSNAVSLYIEKIRKNRKIKPNFNSFYDFVRKDYRKVLADKNVREKDFDVDGFLNVLEPYYKNGEYGYLLNSDKELDLLNKRFIVFELDVVKDNPILFPVVTIIIMETFINKMRRLQGIRKMILIEEA